MNEIIADFDRIRDGVVPDYLCLSVDYSASMDHLPSAHGEGYEEFKSWVVTHYGDIIRARDGAADFNNERWVEEMKTQVQSVLGE